MYKYGAAQELSLAAEILHCGRYCPYRLFEQPSVCLETSPSTERSLQMLQCTVYPRLHQVILVSKIVT
jgi:hypothetical protein